MYNDGSSKGSLVRAESEPSSEQLTIARVENMMIQANQARDLEMKALKLQVETMQRNNHALITTSVATAMDSALNSDSFAEKMVRAMHSFNLELQKSALSAQYAPAAGPGKPSPQGGDPR